MHDKRCLDPGPKAEILLPGLRRIAGSSLVTVACEFVEASCHVRCAEELGRCRMCEAACAGKDRDSSHGSGSSVVVGGKNCPGGKLPTTLR